ncbi:hypothetical protein AGMMS49928_13020 [Spirochaetia bacterium]|nr:hypothetical protein AGMMS49928_13020 [Spirochaetia bacterium]
MSVNNSDWGSVAVSPSNADGLVNGVKSEDTNNPLSYNVTANTTVQAVFALHSSGGEQYQL